jgi:hypothetical protein
MRTDGGWVYDLLSVPWYKMKKLVDRFCEQDIPFCAEPQDVFVGGDVYSVECEMDILCYRKALMDLGLPISELEQSQ